MQPHKLLLLFNHLSGVEKREFTRYIESPYFNKRHEPKALWQYLLTDLAPAGGTWDPAQAFETVYPGEGYDETKLRHPLSWLVKSIESFLLLRRFEQDEMAQALQLAAVFREKNLEKNFAQTLRLAEGQLGKRVKDQAWFHDRYRLEYEKYAFTESQRRTVSNNLPSVAQSLDAYLLAAKLRQSCLQLAHQSVYQADYDYSFLPALLAYIQENPAQLEIPAIALYYHCYRAMSEGSESEFRRFRTLLEENSGTFTREEISDLWLFALNYCIKQLNTGSRPFGQEALELYQLGIEREILLENGVLGRFTYKNTVALALLYGQYDWAQAFIHRYQSMLEAGFRENFYHYNLARYFFSVKNYGRAMELLVKVDDSDLLLNLDSKLMLLKMYYELGEMDALESLLASMNAYICRRKELGYHQTHYLGIIRFTKKLMALRPGDAMAAAALRASIEAAAGLPEKEWLLGRIDAAKW